MIPDQPSGLGKTFKDISQSVPVESEPWFMRFQRNYRGDLKKETMKMNETTLGQQCKGSQVAATQRIHKKLDALGVICSALLTFEGSERVWVLRAATELLGDVD